jgi:signal transduction histidine kinase/ligand-binding sensor domain-containing protein
MLNSFNTIRNLLSSGLLIILCLNLTVVNAQFERPFVKRITHTQGLSHDASRAVIKDSDGFIWISTENGLNRYDGHHFVVFKNVLSDSTSIQGNDVFALCEDAHRNIWISGANFLSRYSMDDHRFYNYPISANRANTYTGFFIKRFYLDQQQRLWMCSVKNGLVLYRPTTDDFEYFLPKKEEPMSNLNNIIDITQSSEQQFWLATSAGLMEFNAVNNVFRICATNPDNPSNFSFFNDCQSLFHGAENDGLIWYGTWGTGLHAYNVKTQKTDVYTFASNVPKNISNIVFDIEIRDENSFWLCTERGLMIFDKTNHTFQLVEHETDNANSLWGGELHHIYVDDEGIIWIPGDHGVELIDPMRQLFKPISTDERPGLYKLNWNAKHKLLVGTSLYTNRSLWLIDPITGHCSHYPIPELDKKMHEAIGLCNLNDGRILIGIARMNPMIFDPITKRFTTIPLSTMLTISEDQLDIRSAQHDNNGNVWMANFRGGIVLWKPSQNTAKWMVMNDSSASAAFKVAVHELIMHGDNIYGFIPHVGIIRAAIQNESIIYLPFQNLDLKKATHIACDRDGHIWFTTPANGIIECELNETLQVKQEYYNELPDQDIDDIFAGSNNDLWINASSGLINFNTQTNTALLFTEKDGLYPYNSDFSLTCDGSDNYYYLTRAGLGTFQQSDLLQPTKYFQTVLSEFFAANKPIMKDTQLSELTILELQPAQNNISFAFGALCYSGVEKLEFAYKLEGFDDDWNYIGSDHNGSYTNLPPGKYTLLLNSKYTSIPWSNNVTRIAITVMPHYYQTWWFRLLVIALAIALIAIAIRTHFQNKLKQAKLELEKQRSIQNIRTRISRDIHDEIGAGLTKITLMSKRLEKTLGDEIKTKEEVQKINNASRQLVQNLGEIVWTINPNNDSLVDLISYLRRYVNDMAESSNVAFVLSLPEITNELNAVLVHPEVKRNVLLIIKESLNNALKHSSASKIELTLTYLKNQMSVNIADNGSGFKMNENERVGNGLRNMRKRAEDIGTTLQINSDNQIGTQVYLLVRI